MEMSFPEHRLLRQRAGVCRTVLGPEQHGLRNLRRLAWSPPTHQDRGDPVADPDEVVVAENQTAEDMTRGGMMKGARPAAM